MMISSLRESNISMAINWVNEFYDELDDLAFEFQSIIEDDKNLDFDEL